MKVFCWSFSSAPVMPGVIIVADTQTGGTLIQVLFPIRKLFLFCEIDNVKFKHKVLPGDTLCLNVI
jgi:UDP-3-O-[3-hydroxymyristoyl] N-acetylglucosamine deacetylase/3-hydroxyacyl-[acyl-carrier-protein] dehydratase